MKKNILMLINGFGVSQKNSLLQTSAPKALVIKVRFLTVFSAFFDVLVYKAKLSALQIFSIVLCVVSTIVFVL